MRTWRIWYRGRSYVTCAKSSAKAINNVRYRESLLYAPMTDFEAEEVRA